MRNSREHLIDGSVHFETNPATQRKRFIVIGIFATFVFTGDILAEGLIDGVKKGVRGAVDAVTDAAESVTKTDTP